MPSSTIPAFGTLQLVMAGPGDRPADLLRATHWQPSSMPIVLAGPSDTLECREAATQESKGHWSTARVVTLTVQGVPDLRTVLDLVNRRPDPSPSQGRHWLFATHPPPGDSRVVRSIFERRLLIPERTYRQVLRQALGTTPHTLALLWRLAMLRRLCPTVEALAAEAGTTTTNLRHWVGQLLGVPLRYYNRCPGWEWVIDASVQNGLFQVGPGEKVGQRGSGAAGRRYRYRGWEPLATP